MVTLRVAAVQTVFSGLAPGEQYAVEGGGHATTATPHASGQLIVHLAAARLAIFTP